MTKRPDDYTLVFDGGSYGNPGKGYGSYAVCRGREKPHIERLEFGDGITNNVAEYRTLIAGLEGLLDMIQESGLVASEVSVEVRGDSRLVLNQVEGNWRVRQPHLRPLRDRARALLRQFGHTRLTWQSRKRSVDLLGH